jgi:hypothetical protein
MHGLLMYLAEQFRQMLRDRDDAALAVAEFNAAWDKAVVKPTQPSEVRRVVREGGEGDNRG